MEKIIRFVGWYWGPVDKLGRRLGGQSPVDYSHGLDLLHFAMFLVFALFPVVVILVVAGIVFL